jgi:DNA-binding LacI/PurR family transcriptional regulator
LLDRAPGITAVYDHNDVMALGVMSALHEKGISVPDDCAVVGYDDIPMAAHAIPPLTIVHVPFYETGETAVRLLLDSIGGRTEQDQRVLLPVRLVRRRSCGAGASGPNHKSSGEE